MPPTISSSDPTMTPIRDTAQRVHCWSRPRHFPGLANSSLLLSKAQVMRHRVGMGVGHHLESHGCNADPGQGERRDKGSILKGIRWPSQLLPLLALRFQKALFIKRKKKKKKKEKNKSRKIERRRPGDLLPSCSQAEVFPGQPSLSDIHPSLPKIINRSLEQNPLENKVHLELKKSWKKGTLFLFLFLTKNILLKKKEKKKEREQEDRACGSWHRV